MAQERLKRFPSRDNLHEETESSLRANSDNTDAAFELTLKKCEGLTKPSLSSSPGIVSTALHASASVEEAHNGRLKYNSSLNNKDPLMAPLMMRLGAFHEEEEDELAALDELVDADKGKSSQDDLATLEESPSSAGLHLAVAEEDDMEVIETDQEIVQQALPAKEKSESTELSNASQHLLMSKSLAVREPGVISGNPASNNGVSHLKNGGAGNEGVSGQTPGAVLSGSSLPPHVTSKIDNSHQSNEELRSWER